MRGEHTIEEQVEQMKEYLGCPCAYYPPSDDCQPMISDFCQARARGKKEGFVPMMVAVDELLLECFELSGEDKDQVRRELRFLSALGERELGRWREDIRGGETVTVTLDVNGCIDVDSFTFDDMMPLIVATVQKYLFQ